jgi:hypothetical protein
MDYGELMEICSGMYLSTSTGLAAEITHVNTGLTAREKIGILAAQLHLDIGAEGKVWTTGWSRKEKVGSK